MAGNLGELALEQGQHDLAVERLEAALHMQRAIGDAAGAARVLTYLGHALVGRGDLKRAGAVLTEALTALREVGYVQSLPDALRAIARLAARRGKAPAAARLYGAEEGLRTALGVLLPPVSRPEHEAAVAAVRRSLGEAAFAAAWAAGRALTLDDVVAEALAATQTSPTLSAPHEPAKAPARYGLTAREVEVLQLLVAGDDSRSIAERLFISPATVARHVANLNGKLGVDSRAKAVAFAYRHGLA